MAGLGFARKLLEKHGWEEGKGLGKEEGGITKAIKVGVKNDTRGVGFDLGEQFTFHWWDHVFNKTAKSIVVKESEDGVEVAKEGSSSEPISNKRPSKDSQKALFYGRFVKASDSAPKEKGASDSGSDLEADKDYSNLHSEDKVFMACGGRTAHKAARHGFRLSGKLQRIQEHEKVALSAPCSRSSSPVTVSAEFVEDGVVSKKQKKREKRSYSDSEECTRKKKKKNAAKIEKEEKVRSGKNSKKQRKRELEICDVEEKQAETGLDRMCRKKAKNSKDNLGKQKETDTALEVHGGKETTKKRKKKSKKSSQQTEELDVAMSTECLKKAKKSKLKETEGNENDNENASENGVDIADYNKDEKGKKSHSSSKGENKEKNSKKAKRETREADVCELEVNGLLKEKKTKSTDAADVRDQIEREQSEEFVKSKKKKKKKQKEKNKAY
ncbi:G patch domain-containing protein 4 isoform X3 [Nematostella vectensis]|uniref:G patch domain-containing protein 4 isoform X3 n=1 Tax=Nematostella vectensis TaxID=45351 RepID=UPI0020771E63|nr:G patch domain-containing protein 4 isoform X3 [Nematostella vectensis]